VSRKPRDESQELPLDQEQQEQPAEEMVATEQPDAQQQEQPAEQMVATEQPDAQQQEQGEAAPKQAPSAPTGFIKNRPAFISLACGLVGLMYYGLLFGPVAVAFGFYGRKIEHQRHIATMGMVIGIIDVLGGFFSTFAR